MLTKIILTTPRRKAPRFHAGFQVFRNPSRRKIPIFNCAEGHYLALQKAYSAGGAALIFEDDVVPVEQWESRMEYGIGLIRQETLFPDPFMFSLYAASSLGYSWEKERPYTLPPDKQEWGQQGMYYSQEMIPIALDLIEAFLRTPPRRILGSATGLDGFDYFLYKASRLLRIPVYYWPLVQHDNRVKSVAQCPSHFSPLLPPVNAGDDRKRNNGSHGAPSVAPPRLTVP